MGPARHAAAAAGVRLLSVLLCVGLAHAQGVTPRIEVVEGEGAINNVAVHRAKEPVVRVVDQDGKPLPNVAVTFLLPDRGAGGSFADGRNSLTTLTDAQGQAVGTGLRPNNTAGQFQIRVSASYEGQVATAVVTQTNAAAQAKSSSKTLLIVLAVAGVAAAGAGAALGKGHSSSPSTPPPVISGVTITPGTPRFTPPPHP